jgi:hypothetical protein
MDKWEGGESFSLRLDIEAGTIFFKRSGQEKEIYKDIATKKGDLFFPALSCSGECEITYDLKGCLNGDVRQKVNPDRLKMISWYFGSLISSRDRPLK